GNAPARRVAEAHSENWPWALDLLAAGGRGAGARPVDRRDGRRSGGGRCDLRDRRGGKRPGYGRPRALRREAAALDRRTILLDLSRPLAGFERAAGSAARTGAALGGSGDRDDR